VDDAATSELMKSFHERMQTGTDSSRADSLRQAQIAMLKNRETRHPMFWAPFVLTGDWRK
jgi:CHAT domain-containing protein